MDWKSVAEKIVQDDQDKWDQRWLAEELEIAKLGHDVWPFSDLAVSQFCQKLDIPVRYFKRLPDEMKIVVANYDLERLKGTSFLVRGKAIGYARSCQPSMWPTTIQRSPRPRRACLETERSM